MMLWDVGLLSMDFKPSVVEDITGYSVQLQRKWAERYFDFRGASSVWGGDQAYRWYSWVGVQMLTVFGDVLTDLGSAKLARAALMAHEVPGLHRNAIGTFEHDWRERPAGDDFLSVCDLGQADPMFLTAGQGNLSLGERYYIYNLSGMQRRLHARAAELGLIESA